jgi:hypothetical protein
METFVLVTTKGAYKIIIIIIIIINKKGARGPGKKGNDNIG